MESRFSDFCRSFALSDPHEPAFRVDNPEHKNLRRNEKCKKMDVAIQVMSGLVHKLAANKELSVDVRRKMGRNEEAMEIYKERIKDMKAHYMRLTHMHYTKQSILEDLADNHAILYLDYAPRWNPNGQKKGVSWHVIHAIAKVSGRRVAHYWVHIMKDSEQTSSVVVQILVAALKDLHRMGIAGVHLQSHTAGYYRCEETLFSMNSVSEKTGVQVKSWNFDEEDTAVSPTDRIIAVVQRKMRRYKHEVVTAQDMFDAIVEPRLLGGLSVHLMSAAKEEKSTVDVDDVTDDLSDFAFDE
ncbi:hypothetical protein PFISCL1PPCAC_13986 [Pristionchus fissidentatus]|uniref:Uncharacterized protein n=1 Tax=Pristionchus fissidentatus TaxID=1538716 RepID=A0AAV5VY86_9BILA|nr:hypothetical protein PFISCL1PPCAC_13986 [Pristionchus fissidentatus]